MKMYLNSLKLIDKIYFIIIKQTLHFFNKIESKLLKVCKNNLKTNGVLIIFS